MYQLITEVAKYRTSVDIDFTLPFVEKLRSKSVNDAVSSLDDAEYYKNLFTMCDDTIRLIDLIKYFSCLWDHEFYMKIFMEEFYNAYNLYLEYQKTLVTSPEYFGKNLDKILIQSPDKRHQQANLLISRSDAKLRKLVFEDKDGSRLNYSYQTLAINMINLLKFECKILLDNEKIRKIGVFSNQYDVTKLQYWRDKVDISDYTDFDTHLSVVDYSKALDPVAELYLDVRHSINNFLSNLDEECYIEVVKIINMEYMKRRIYIYK